MQDSEAERDAFEITRYADQHRVASPRVDRGDHHRVGSDADAVGSGVVGADQQHVDRERRWAVLAHLRTALVELTPGTCGSSWNTVETRER